MTSNTSATKKRKPIFSAFLSLISLGLGQVYNGELLKGIILKIILLISICLYTFLLFKNSNELLFLMVLLFLFVLLKTYSIFQAFFKSRKLASSFSLRKYNKAYFYVVLTIGFLVLNVFLPITISRYALMEMTAHHPFRSAKARKLYLESYDKWAKNWPVVSESRMIDTSYGQTFVRISGPVDAPVLVLLPGANATSLMWIPNIEALSESYRTYAVDNIYDFGRSVFTQTIKAPDDFVSWLDELFRALELRDNINLMGLSYGGWLTSQYALHSPNRLDKIVLVAPASTVLPLSPEFLNHAILVLVPHRSFVRSVMNWVLEDLLQKDEGGRKLVEGLTENTYLGLRCFKPKMLVSPAVLTDQELQNLRMPALFLVGENEKIYSAQEAIQRLNKVAPHIKTELIPNAGHDLSVVQSEMVNRKILEFLKQQ